MNSPKRIYKYLSHSKHNIEELITRATAIDLLNPILHSFLDKSLKNHCLIANFRDGTLILLTDSPAWVSRLRYQMPTLLKQLQEIPEFDGLIQIKIRIQPKYLEPSQPKIQREPLSTMAAHCLTTLADTINNNSLKNVLHRLASRSKNKQN